MRDSWLRRLVFAHLCSAIAEWAVTVALLVHAFRWGGTAAVGAISLVLLGLPLLCTAFVGSAMVRWRPLVVRATGLGLQLFGYSGAALAALLDSPSPLVVPFVVIGLAGAASTPPSGAALMPLIARSADDLISATLWVGHGDSVSALTGPLMAGVVAAALGPSAVFGLCAASATVALVLTTWRPAPLARAGRLVATAAGARRPIRRALAEMRARPWSRGVLAVSSARNILVGGFDVILVVLALEELDLGDGGPGLLSALVGGGAFLSTFFVTLIVRRSRLQRWLIAAIAAAAAVAVTLGAWTATPVVVIGLVVMGLTMAAMDALGRTLLQRSTDPRQLGPMFAALGFAAGLGQLAGSIVAQVAIAVEGPRAALLALGVVLVTLACLGAHSLRRADAHTELPVIEMTLLSRTPLLSSLPSVGLERVARLATRERVQPGTVIMREGAPGFDCVVVVDGTFEVTSMAARRRVASRGDALGELALLTNLGRTATVTALTPGEVLRIGREPFLVAMTGFDVAVTVDVADNALAVERYRDLVMLHDRQRAGDPEVAAEAWLGLGAAGRMLGSKAFTGPLRRVAGLATSASDRGLLAYAAAITTWPGSFFHVAEQPDQELIELCESALDGLDADDPMRVRVLATVACQATFAYDADRRRQLIDEAMTLAQRHGDLALKAAVLNAEFVCLWEPATFERRRQIATELTEIGVDSGDAETEFVGRFFGAYCLTEAARLVEARLELTSLRPVLDRARIEFFEFLTERLIISIDIASGVGGMQDRIDALAKRHVDTHADTDGTWALQTGALAYQQGALGPMRPMIASMTDGPHARTWQAALALVELRDGDREAARRTLERHGDVPRNYFWLTVMQVRAEVAAELGLVEHCKHLYDELVPFRGRLGITASGTLCFGLVTRSLGELALAMGRTADAVALLSEAVERADEAGMPFEAQAARRLLMRAAAPHRAALDAT